MSRTLADRNSSDITDERMSSAKKGSENLYTISIPGRIGKLVRERGFRFFLRKLLTVAGRVAYARTFLRFRKPASFSFRGAPYRYFCHPYNFTWDNERAVEIPIALDMLARHRGGRILEVGNVLSHYVPADWDIVDKYERGRGVIPADAVTYRPDEPYDLIISISTLEHIGFDDYPRDPSLIPQALENLVRTCLRPGGRLIATVPVGYNPNLDRMLFGGELGFSEIACLKRTGRYAWREATAEEVRGTSYAKEYIEAGAVVVAEFTQPHPQPFSCKQEKGATELPSPIYGRGTEGEGKTKMEKP